MLTYESELTYSLHSWVSFKFSKKIPLNIHYRYIVYMHYAQ